MSEQTPDTNNNLSDGQDPSMEDILASIRKIIADDDGQDSLEAIVDDVPELKVQDAPRGDLTELAHTDLASTDLASADLTQGDTLDLDITSDDTSALDMDIEALIGDMDAQSSGALEIPQIETSALSGDVVDDVLDLEIPMDESETEALAMDDTLDLAQTGTAPADRESEFEAELDDLIADLDNETNTDDDIIRRPEPPKPARGLMGGAMAALGLGGAAAKAKEPAEDDLSLMLDNMLEDSAAHQEEAVAAETPIAPEGDIGPAEDLLSELDMGDDETQDASSSETDPDMDLVKSLMADLTEETLHDEDAPAPSEAMSVNIDDDAETDDVMDEILSMTLDDETKLSEEIAILEIAAPDAEAQPLSLKEIAAQAEADAESSDSVLGKGLAAAAGLGVVGAAAIAAAPQEDGGAERVNDDVDAALSQLDELLAEDMAEPDELDNPTPPDNNITDPHLEETPTMARAKKSDAIIDEVTESATAGAFASLTSVVEEKATVAERGDRIGDLVMEALQPMLKEWLDANLKGIVERAVTKEVKRISSGK